jgi:hypothetical protein
MHTALNDDVAPVVGEVRVQGAHAGDGGMDVAVDAARFEVGHAGLPMSVKHNDRGEYSERPMAASCGSTRELDRYKAEIIIALNACHREHPTS